MANGKKGRARVPGAPRAIQTRGASTVPWYRRRSLQISVVVIAVAALVLIPVLISRSNDDDVALERRQDRIEEFTGEVLALLQRVSASASEMVTATADSKTLAKDAKRWDRLLSQVQQDATATVQAAPPELDAANRLIFQAILQYVAAAKTYQLVPRADGGLAADVHERAAAQVAAADGTWTAGITVLDEERRDAKLDPSAIRAPSQVAPAPTTTPTGGRRTDQ